MQSALLTCPEQLVSRKWKTCPDTLSAKTAAEQTSSGLTGPSGVLSPNRPVNLVAGKKKRKKKGSRRELKSRDRLFKAHQFFFSLWAMLTTTCSPPRVSWSPAESRHTTVKRAGWPSLPLCRPDTEWLQVRVAKWDGRTHVKLLWLKEKPQSKICWF